MSSQSDTIWSHSVKLGDLTRELGLTISEVARVTEKPRNKSLIKQYSRELVFQISHGTLLYEPRFKNANRQNTIAINISLFNTR